MQEFETGAYRTSDTGKVDYEGSVSPIALRRYVEYKKAHREGKNGEIRKDDNWQLGIPIENYMKSLYRHFQDVHLIHDGYKAYDDGKEVSLEDALCAIWFNVQGYLHEVIKKRLEKEV